MSRREGEYRVTLLEYHGTNRGEDIAYYTDDLEDAVLTGAAMRRIEDSVKKVKGKANYV